LAIVLGAVGVVGAVMGFVLKALHESARSHGERASLLAKPPIRVRQAAATGLFYRIGVDAEAAEALAIFGSGEHHAPYLQHDVDEDLRSALQAASRRDGATLIVISGRSTAGKSRTLMEGVTSQLPDAWLLLPRDPTALVKLADADPPREVGTGPSIVWLDDIELWAKPAGQGLSPDTLEALSHWRQPVLVLATEGGKGVDLAGPEAAQFHEITSDLLTRARQLRLDSEVTKCEAMRIGERFGDEVATRIGRDGIGEFMIAAPRLIARLDTDRECPEGQAIARAAIDCQRAGLLRPLPSDWLQALYVHYLAGPATNELFLRGLAWVTHPLFARTALLSRAEDDSDSYEPYDFIVDYSNRKGRPIKGASAAFVGEVSAVAG
jgi:hypothetical protein